MSNLSPSRQLTLKGFKLTHALAPLTLGVTLLSSTQMPAEALPVVVQSPLPTTHIYGSPIPSPVPVVPGTTTPYSLSPHNYPNYSPNYYPATRPTRRVIRNSTLINPTVINSTISDSVLVDPVIINTPRSTRRVIRHPGVIYNSPRIIRITGY